MGRRRQRLVEVGEDVIDVFDADREADEFGGDSGGALLFLVELGMSGGGRVDRQRFGIADVGEVFEKFEGIDEFRAGFGPTLDAEDDHGSAFATQVFVVQRGLRIAGQAGETDPLDDRMV